MNICLNPNGYRHSAVSIYIYRSIADVKKKEKLRKGKGKVHPRTGHEGPEGE